MRPRRPLIRIISIAVLMVMLFHGGGAVVQANSPAIPPQMYRPLLFDQTYPAAFPIVIAHNAGDQAASTRRALAHSAQIIEIDVVVYGGALYAAHDTPHSWISRLVWWFSPPPTLEKAWESAANAGAVQLDIKTASSTVIPLLRDVLDKKLPETRFVLSSEDRELLSALGSLLPGVQTVLSIGDAESLRKFESVQADDQLSGVSIRAALLTPDIVDQLHQQGLFVIAWTVDDQMSFDAIRQLPVDAISTNNLAIVERSGVISPLLSGNGNGRVFDPGVDTTLLQSRLRLLTPQLG